MATGYEPARGPDWWSRLIATGSLIVAGATAAWTYQQLKDQPTRDQMVELITSRTAALEKNELEAREKRDREAQQALAGVRAEARETFDQHRQLVTEVTSLKVALNERWAETDQRLDAIARADYLGPENSAADIAEESPADAAAVADSGTTPAEAPADTSPILGPVTDDDQVLVAVHSTLRASDPLEGLSQWSVHNNSAGNVEVSALEFSPRKVVTLEKPVSLEEATAEAADAMQVVLSPEENKTSREGYHGRYRWDFTEKYHIPAQANRELRMVINDPRHAGYGLEGDLLVYFDQDTEPLTIENFRVLFVSPAP